MQACCLPKYFKDGGLPVFFVSLFRCLARFPLPLNLQSYNFQGFLLEFVGCVKHFWYIYLNQGNPQGRKIYLQEANYESKIVAARICGKYVRGHAAGLNGMWRF